MPIHFACHMCGQKYRVAGHSAGNVRMCLKCGEPMTVPSLPRDEIIELSEAEPAVKRKKRQGSNYSAAALACGLASLFCAPVGILAVVFGIRALNSPHETGKPGNAIMGIVFGCASWGLGYLTWGFLVSGL